MSNFAVIQTGGKQYKVSPGSVFNIEKLAGKHAKGDKLDFDKVLLTESEGEVAIGTPYLTNNKVEGEILEIGRAKKVQVIKYKQKSRYLRRKGHRQPYFKVKILFI